MSRVTIDQQVRNAGKLLTLRDALDVGSPPWWELHRAAKAAFLRADEMTRLRAAELGHAGARSAYPSDLRGFIRRVESA